MRKTASRLLLLSSLAVTSAFAQSSEPVDPAIIAKTDTFKVVLPAKPRPSPMAVAFHKEDAIYLKATYCQPVRKGRKVFAELAPYGKLWRTGANEATEITFTKDVKMGGKMLKAGTYTLFTIPNPDKWTIIFNTELGQWGDYKYDATKDILTFEVPSRRNTEIYEAFTIQFEETNKGADIVLLWDDTKVAIPVEYAR